MEATLGPNRCALVPPFSHWASLLFDAACKTATFDNFGKRVRSFEIRMHCNFLDQLLIFVVV